MIQHRAPFIHAELMRRPERLVHGIDQCSKLSDCCCCSPPVPEGVRVFQARTCIETHLSGAQCLALDVPKFSDGFIKTLALDLKISMYASGG